MSDESEQRAEARESSGARAEREGARATSLDITDAEMRELADAFVALTTDYFAGVTDLSVYKYTSSADLSRLFDRPLPADGEPLERLMDDCRALVGGSRQNGHPRMFGYVASPSTPVGAFANLFASALNQNVPAWRSSPAATVIERNVVRRLAELIGYGAECGGLLTSGGSMANLNALFVAHRTKTGEAHGGAVSQKGLWNATAPATIYVSDQVHLSIPKAVDLMGIGREQVRVIASDENFRTDVRALRERIEQDRAAGLRPFCVVASAGTVNTGAIDPLADIAHVAREHDLWFHVDGAYGALAALDESKRELFDGLALADSVSLDPHKWLYAPLDCGCLLYRRPEEARAAFAGTEEHYVKIFEQEPDEAFAFWDYGIELSRPFRALKIWMMLRYYGTRRIAASIAEDCAVAAYFAARVSAAEDFQLLAPTTLGICCFRYTPPETRRRIERAADEAERERLNVELDELNFRLMQNVQRGGRAYLSNTTLRGRFALRASITNFRTTRRDVDVTLDILRDAATAQE
ncbi:MAG: aminotransferase class I/II-fold pyridoxal phosphate-dependent enzyme [Pyrinomonadaceae bacterium]